MDLNLTNCLLIEELKMIKAIEEEIRNLSNSEEIDAIIKKHIESDFFLI